MDDIWLFGIVFAAINGFNFVLIRTRIAEDIFDKCSLISVEKYKIVINIICSLVTTIVLILIIKYDLTDANAFGSQFKWFCNAVVFPSAYVLGTLYFLILTKRSVQRIKEIFKKYQEWKN
jgi:hypothetical protein